MKYFIVWKEKYMLELIFFVCFFQLAKYIFNSSIFVKINVQCMSNFFKNNEQLVSPEIGCFRRDELY